jgi:hypothetical protein
MIVKSKLVKQYRHVTYSRVQIYVVNIYSINIYSTSLLSRNLQLYLSIVILYILVNPILRIR